jgi:hypothetical protein
LDVFGGYGKETGRESSIVKHDIRSRKLNLHLMRRLKMRDIADT